MKTITRIQIEPGETAAPQQIPVQQVTATASRLPGVEWVDLRLKHGNFTKDAGFSRWSVEADRFIARFREIMQKQGAR
jgi:hypothetical protein